MKKARESKSTEIPLNRKVLHLLGNLEPVLTKKGNSPLRIANDTTTILNGDMTLATLSPSSIHVLGENFEDRILDQTAEKKSTLDDDKFTNFLDVIGDRIVRLNHIGISYFTDDLAQEAARLRDLAHTQNIPLYREPSTDQEQNWLFLGDADNWEDPLFEFVLNTPTATINKPHIQIDLDTTLSLEEIQEITAHYLREGFVHRHLFMKKDCGMKRVKTLLWNSLLPNSSQQEVMMREKKG